MSLYYYLLGVLNRQRSEFRQVQRLTDLKNNLIFDLLRQIKEKEEVACTLQLNILDLITQMNSDKEVMNSSTIPAIKARASERIEANKKNIIISTEKLKQFAELSQKEIKILLQKYKVRSGSYINGINKQLTFDLSEANKLIDEFANNQISILSTIEKEISE